MCSSIENLITLLTFLLSFEVQAQDTDGLSWDKNNHNTRGEYNYTIEVNSDGHIKCTGDVEKVETRVWSPYYIYDNDVKTQDVQRLYGDEICQLEAQDWGKNYCTDPSELKVLRTYDSIIDTTRRLLMIENSAKDVFYMQYTDNGMRNPFMLNEKANYFWIEEPLPYETSLDYFRGFPYDSVMSDEEALQFTEFIVHNLIVGNSTFAALFNNSCPVPYSVYEFVAETYAQVESKFDYYMVHLHCSANQKYFYSLMVSADRYCQWNKENESFWFVGLKDLQTGAQMVTPSYNWWDQPNVDKNWLFPGPIDVEPVEQFPHGIWDEDDASSPEKFKIVELMNLFIVLQLPKWWIQRNIS